jgi:hypothetical protein
LKSNFRRVIKRKEYNIDTVRFYDFAFKLILIVVYIQPNKNKYSTCMAVGLITPAARFLFLL